MNTKQVVDSPYGEKHQRIAGIVLHCALLTTGWIAGTYYAFSCAVMPGLAFTDDRTLVMVMQQINIRILNPVFATSFFGALVLPVVAVVLYRRLGQRETVRWVLAALALYSVSLLITAGVNIPLNEELNRTGNLDQISHLSQVRHQFEGSWVVANALRAIAATAAFFCLGQALVSHGRGQVR